MLDLSPANESTMPISHAIIPKWYGFGAAMRLIVGQRNQKRRTVAQNLVTAKHAQLGNALTGDQASCGWGKQTSHSRDQGLRSVGRLWLFA